MREKFRHRPTIYLHYQGARDDPKDFCLMEYRDMFDILSESVDYRHVIVDRPHNGQIVWASLYKGYETGKEIRNLERDFMLDHPIAAVRTLQFFIFDEPAAILEREKARKDGYSYNASDLDEKSEELSRYIEVANKSRLNTHIIWIRGKSSEDVLEEIWEDVEDFADGLAKSDLKVIKEG
jgi:hypothetical protein